MRQQPWVTLTFLCQIGPLRFCQLRNARMTRIVEATVEARAPQGMTPSPSAIPFWARGINLSACHKLAERQPGSGQLRDNWKSENLIGFRVSDARQSI
jgi:hypothetical protein